MYRQHAHMLKHMCACCRQTRERFESRHGGALDDTAVFQRATPHNTYRTPNTHTQHHTETQRERARERERDRDREKTVKEREEKMKEEKEEERRERRRRKKQRSHVHQKWNMSVSLFCSFSHEKLQSGTRSFHDMCCSKSLTFHNGFMFVLLVAVSRTFSKFRALLYF